MRWSPSFGGFFTWKESIGRNLNVFGMMQPNCRVVQHRRGIWHRQVHRNRRLEVRRCTRLDMVRTKSDPRSKALRSGTGHSDFFLLYLLLLNLRLYHDFCLSCGNWSRKWPRKNRFYFCFAATEDGKVVVHLHATTPKQSLP